MHRNTRIAASLVASSIAALAVLTGGVASSADAAAQAQTLRYYNVSASTHFYDSAGKALNIDPPTTLPTKGDRLDELDRDYIGSQSRHAAHATASDRLRCTFTDADTADCRFTMTIGRSELSARYVQHFQDHVATYRLSRATGAFAGMHGTLTASETPNGETDLVIKLA